MLKIQQVTIEFKEEEEMKITVERNAAGFVKAYFVDGVKTLKAKIDALIYDYLQATTAAGQTATIEIDSCLVKEFRAITRSPYKNFSVVNPDVQEKKLAVCTAQSVDTVKAVDPTRGVVSENAVCTAQSVDSVAAVNTAQDDVPENAVDIAQDGDSDKAQKHTAKKEKQMFSFADFCRELNAKITPVMLV
ncbi:MAG: hypothetical protein IJP62_11285, partial [Treponema sp.]|nr:hypothetical protein [Treponema sp.]